MARFGFLLIAALGAAGSMTPALAQDDVCAALEARLSGLDRASQDYWDTDMRRTEAAIARKRGELDQAMAAQRRAGCGTGLFGRKGGQCRALNAEVSRLEGGLNRLAAQRRSFADDPYAAERERSELMTAMAEQGCVSRAPPGGFADNGWRRERKANRLFGSLFGGTRPFRGGRWGGRGGWGDDFGYGAYRTLCVRTCDGYYFPISFSTGQGQFATDEMACRARCPGTDVALYVYRNPGEGPEQAVSLAGEPYAMLPAAFRYRKEYDRACACGQVVATTGADVAIIGYPPETSPGFGLTPENATPVLAMPALPAAEPEPAIPGPKARPSGDPDPETAANRAGEFVPGRTKAEPAPEETVAIGPDGKAVRLVGPPPFGGEEDGSLGRKLRAMPRS